MGDGLSYPDNDLPGLHFGEAGVAAALSEAIAANLIERKENTENFILKILNGRVDWPDFTHGAAGQGVSCLYVGSRLENKSMMELSGRCASYLINSQKSDGSWGLSNGGSALKDTVYSGFAHGVAGIVYFLSEYAFIFNDTNAERVWKKGVEWLEKNSIPNPVSGALEWNFSNQDESKWKWWCNGSPGIALTFLRLYERTREERYADIAKRALRVHSLDPRFSNLSLCHGLSGLGEIYLEAFRILKEERWLESAKNIARTLQCLGRDSENNSVCWLTEDPNFPRGDLMVGGSGISHFFLKFANNDKLSFPLLLDPIEQRDKRIQD
ncbi:lanthionine synthetase LanC family protein [Nitrososphaera sp.]|uniref:lanthionine synthetase LanC family protein n=1 Tax=Nitrososphaera sp. TaxID=1971748 RepID=UPI002600FF7F|nr:lanthionine synthetase LanC family protein [Nitrososphaera sp.]